jgi:hypothetical protein
MNFGQDFCFWANFNHPENFRLSARIHLKKIFPHTALPYSPAQNPHLLRAARS